MSRTKQLGRDEAAAWPRRESSPPLGPQSVLFEGDDGAEAVAVSHALDGMGIETMWCPGPRKSHGAHCPLVEEGHCELMEKADYVINNLGTHDPCCAEVAAATARTQHGDKPVAVVTGRQDAAAVRARLPGCTVVEGPLTRKLVTDIVRPE